MPPPTSCGSNFHPGALVPVTPAGVCLELEQGGCGARSHDRFTFQLQLHWPQAKSPVWHMYILSSFELERLSVCTGLLRSRDVSMLCSQLRGWGVMQPPSPHFTEEANEAQRD